MRPVLTLIWEQWRQNRWVFLRMCLLAGMLLAWIWLDRLNPLTAASEGTYTVIIKFFMLMASMVFAGLAFTWKEGRNSLQFRVPPRVLALPVRTPALATTLFFAKFLPVAAFVGLFALVAGRVALDDATALWKGIDDFHVDIMLTPTGVAMAAAAFLAIAWCPPGLRILAILLVFPALRWAPDVTRSASVYIYAVSVLLGAYIVALMGVCADRSGRWAHLYAGWAALGGGRKRPFRSPAHAQAWYETKTRTGHLPWAFLALFILFHASIMASWDGKDELISWMEDTSIMSTAGVAAVATVVLGLLIVAADCRDHVSGLSTFALTRPLATRRLARARLTAGSFSLLRTYLLALLICTCAVGAAFLITRDGHSLRHFLRELQEPPMLAMLILFIPAVSWSSLWLSAPLVATLAPPTAFLMFRILEHLNLAEYLLGALVPWALVTVLLTATAFTLAARRHLLTRRAVIPLLMAWLAGSALFVTCFWGVGFLNRRYLVSEETIVAVFTPIFALIALLPFATVPLSLHWFRHR